MDPFYGPLSPPPLVMHSLGGPPLVMPPLGLRSPPMPLPGPLLYGQPLPIPPPRWRRRPSCVECKLLIYSSRPDAAIGFRGGPRGACLRCLEVESEMRRLKGLEASGQHYPGSMAESPNMYGEPPPPYTTQAGMPQDGRWDSLDGAQFDHDTQNYADDREAYGDETQVRRAHAQGQDRAGRQKHRSESPAPKARAQSQPPQSNERMKWAGHGRAESDTYVHSDREAEDRPPRKASKQKNGDDLQGQRHRVRGKMHHAYEEDPGSYYESFEDRKNTAEDLEGAFGTLSVGQEGRAKQKQKHRGSTKLDDTEGSRERGGSQESPARDAGSRSKSSTHYSSTITIINGIEAHPLIRVSHDVTKGSWRTPPASTIEASATDMFTMHAIDSEGCGGKVQYKLHNGTMMTLSFTCSEDVNEISITPKVLRNLFRLDIESKVPLICTVHVLEVHSQASRSS